MNTQSILRWATSLLSAAIVASLSYNSAQAADNDQSIAGFADSAGAFLDLAPYRPARLIVYENDSSEEYALVVYRVGDRTFGYDPHRGSHYCSLSWTASDQALASNWCRRPVQSTSERTRTEILGAGYRSKQGDYENGCLVDSLVAYERVARTNRDANWEGVFILVRGTDELGGGHAVCIYLIGTVGWIYDPIGRQLSSLGPIDPQMSATIARKLDPQASGGWLENRDLAWLRRHGRDLAQTGNQ